MLLARHYVGYISRAVVRRLLAAQMIEVPSADALAQKVRQVILDELSVEDRLNEEVREILSHYADRMRRERVSYQEMYKKVKGQLARERKLILR